MKVTLSFVLLVIITATLWLILCLHLTRWKRITWLSTHQEGLFMVVMAASLNGCYGYLHTRNGAELRLAVLLSLVHSPHFCLITDLSHWWRCEASPRSRWVGGDGGAVLACVCVQWGWCWSWSEEKGWGEVTGYFCKHFVGHCVTVIVCLLTHSSLLLTESTEMGPKHHYSMLTGHNTNNTK